MNASRFKKRSSIVVSTIVLLHLIFGILTHLIVPPGTAFHAFLAAFLVMGSAVLLGPYIGLASGIVVDLIQIISISVHEGMNIITMAGNLLATLGSSMIYLLIALPFSGLLFGFISELTINKTRLLEKRLRETNQKNKSMAEQLKIYEHSIRSLVAEPDFKPSWSPLIEAGKLSAPLISLFLLSLNRKTMSTTMFGNKMVRTSDGTEEPNTILFNMLSNLRPDVLAIVSSEGMIIQYNRKLMAVFGIPAVTSLEQVSILELLDPDSVDKARTNLAQAMSSAVNRSERYLLRSVGGRFTKTLVSSEVSFDLIAGPAAVAVLVSEQTNFQLYHASHELFKQDRRPSHAHSLTDLMQREICCLSANGHINYFSTQVARTLGLPPGSMLGQPLENYIHPKQQHAFRILLENCMKGNRTTFEFEMAVSTNVPTVLLLDAYPSVGEAGTYLGLLVLMDNITDAKQVENALHHRLVIEQLISRISSQFISLKIDELDQEICTVLNTFEELESVADCSIEIHKLNQTNRHLVFRSKDCGNYARSNSPAKVTPQDTFELVSVPIEIQSETVGYFRFSHEKYRDDWIKSDLDLIRTIGEIIVSALIRKENELNIKLNENRLLTTLHSIGDAVIATDTDGQVVLMNQKAEALTGWGWDDARLQPIDQVFRPKTQIVPSCVYPPYSNSSDEQPVVDDNVLLVARDGKQVFVSVSQSPIVDHAQEYFGKVTVFRDITRKKQEEDKIRYISYHDKLTDLYNRAFFEEELLRLNTRRQYPITIILGDCNGLKIANDIFGHLEGDRLLVTIAGILKRATRHEDIVARWGGDEFAIIMPRTDEQAAEIVRNRILQFCTEAESNPIQPSLALGSSTNTDGSNDLIKLLKTAEDRMYRHKLMESKSARNSLIMSIGKMVYEKSFETEEHANRMSDMAKRVARVIGLSDFELEELSLLTLLHDIGKVGIPDKILLKPDRLSDDEWEVMKKHSEKGYNLAKSTPELVNIADSILHHHERWDGTGYPAGLRGEEIPKLARVLSIIDTFDVITHPRAYKQAQSVQAALQEIESCAGTQFDPELAKVFIDIMSKQRGSEERQEEFEIVAGNLE